MADHFYGDVRAILVRDDRGFRVYGTIPWWTGNQGRAFVERVCRVNLTATLEPSSTIPHPAISRARQTRSLSKRRYSRITASTRNGNAWAGRLSLEGWRSLPGVFTSVRERASPHA
jgi:hypothetical protein